MGYANDIPPKVRKCYLYIYIIYIYKTFYLSLNVREETWTNKTSTVALYYGTLSIILNYSSWKIWFIP